jgi:hypothetical protein
VSGPAAFGALATRVAARLPADLRAVVCEPATAVFALAAAVDRRFDGEPFFASIVLDDPRATVAARFGAALGAQARSYDERRAFFDGLMRGDIAINGVALGTMSVYDANTVKTMHDFMLVAQALLVRSQAERRVLETLAGRRRAHVATFPGFDHDVPGVRRAGRGDAIVIWAPRRPAAELAVHVFALEELFVPVLLVCAGGTLDWSRASIVPAAEGAAALERAILVIDGSDDPATALALAATRLPLAASSTSGAGEYLDAVTIFDPWHWKSLLSAASTGVALRAASPRAQPDRAALAATLEAARPPAIAGDAPLVTIFVPTYNRRHLLPGCLDRLSQQRYPNFEILVVNDAGDDVSDIVAAYPRARLIDRPVNGGAFAAANTACQNARGEYVGFCTDDDILHVDHIARLVAAMRETGYAVASSNHILRFLAARGDGSFRTTGFFIQAAGDLDRTELLASNPIQIWMVHRSVVAERLPNFFDTELTVLADYDVTLAFALEHDIAHVDEVTAVGIYTDEGTQLSRAKRERIPADLEIIYARHPVPGRALVETLRAQTLRYMQTEHVAGGGFRPAIALPAEGPD